MSLTDLQNQPNSSKFVPDEYETFQTPTPPHKKKRTTLWVVLFFCLLILGGGGAVAYYLYQQQNESTAYQVLIDNERVEDYEDFLQRFPNSSRAAEVKMRLGKLKAMYAEWGRMENSAYISDFERFKENYPSSLLVKQCDLKIDSLDWVQVSKANTADAISGYIQRHPNGRYLTEANLALNTLVASKPSESEVQLIATTIAGFYEAFGANDEATLITYITPIMSTFLNKTNATKAQVTDIISSTYNDHILHCRFVLNNDYVCTKHTDESNNVTYNVTFTVDQHITRDNPGKVFGSYTAEAKLNEMFKLSALTMTEVSRKTDTTEEADEIN